MSRTGLEVAVVGLSGRFPGGGDVARFWASIVAKQESISRFTLQELRDEGIPEALLSSAGYVPAAGIVANKEYFDPQFFGYSPNEARLMDPQLRIFLECVWEALEHAGCDPLRFGGKIGLYAGCSPNLGWELLVRDSELRDEVGDYSASLISDRDLLTQHVSYRLNLRGPSVNLQTACSTSLVAVHLAIQGLLGGDCEVALAGGVSVSCLRKSGYLYQPGMTLSPDGHCRAFDERAAGTVFGEGAGVVVLKLLDGALASGDHIHAIIRSSAVNNDGREKVGFTATSVGAQIDLIRTAHRAAGIEPADVAFVEAHGTGTPMGDPIEVDALGRVFGPPDTRACAIGTVKTNVGHLNRAAGIAGLIKTVMALNDRVIPPQLHFSRANPEIDFAKTPFYVSTEVTSLPEGERPAVAGVSSFGLGGTNAHIVIEEPPAVAENAASEGPQLVVLSAKSAAALDEMTNRLADVLEGAARPPMLADVAYTLREGRAAFEFRRAFVASSTGELAADARRQANLDDAGAVQAERIVFTFPGQGAQHRNMGRALYDRFPGFRRLVDECLESFRRRLGWDLRPNLYPDGDPTPSRNSMAEMRIAQPALFVVQYSLARFLIEAGVRPAAMIGYSFGEYVAACLAGVLPLESALALAAFRGELMDGLPEGEMLSVPLSEASIVPRLRPGLSLAAVNGPACIISGEPSAVRDFERAMATQGLLCMPVKTRIAGHCQMPSHVTERLRETIRSLQLSPVATPYVSSLTGEWLPAGSVLDADYWVKHMISPVRFYQGIEMLARQPHALFVEVGAGRDLTLLTGRLLQPEANHGCINLIPPEGGLHDAETYALKQLGRLWSKGLDLRWEPIFDRRGRRKVPLPTYPFQRQAYWPQSDVYSSYGRLKDEAARGGRAAPDTWGYVGTWRRAECVEEQARPASVPGLSIVFMDNGPLGARLVEELERHGGRVVQIRQGLGYAVAGANEYVVDPERAEDYADAITAAVPSGDVALTIFHLWQVDGAGPTVRGWDEFAAEQFRGYFSLQFLARALGRRGAANPVDLVVVADWLQNVLGDEATCPAKATVLGAVQVIPMEHPRIRCRSVDIAAGVVGRDVGRCARMLIAELSAPGSDAEVAHRRGWRWVRAYARVSLPSADGLVERLKPSAAYLVTGGMGGMGLVMARTLAQRKPVQLILTGRSPFPQRSEWSHWLETRGPADPVSRKIVQLREIEDLGSKVWVIQADCSDYAAMKASLDALAGEVGEVLGVIHAAGVTDGALVQRRSVAGCLAVMKPKIQGLYVLQRLFPVSALDFFVACSSIGSVIPSVGQVAYCAANIFLDRWTAERTLVSQSPCWSIGWDIWTESGMGRRSYLELKAAGAVPELVRAKEIALRSGITDREGAEIFVRLLAQSAPHVVVSTQPLDDAIARRARDVADVRRLKEQDVPPPDRPHSRPDRRTPYRAPETEAQRALCRIWAAYFGVDEVSLDDDFFELGGDSLKANVVLRRIHKELGVFVSLADFYENSRVDTLAQLIYRTHKTEHSAIPRAAPADFYELSHAQFRLWLLHEHGHSGPAYNRSSILKFRGPLELTSYRDSLRVLIERHESLRTAFVSRNGVPAQAIQPHLDFSLIEDDLTDSADLYAEVRTRIQEELTHVFDLAAPPLFRVRVLRVSADEVISVFTIHHIVCDERSIHVLHREWSTLYNSSLSDRDALPSLPVQYKDYAAWNNRLADGADPASESHRAFWLQYLGGELPQTTVPADKERPSTKTYRGENVTGLLPREIATRLLLLARDGKLSTFMTLAALVEVLLHRYTGEEDLVLGTAVSGRDHAQLENQVGFYVNTLPLRYRISSELTFRELLSATKTATLAAFEYQNYPFDKIVEDCKPSRDPSRNPLFEILILLHPDEGSAAQFDGLHAEPLSFPSHTSLFDLTFNFRHERGEIRFVIEYNPDLYLRLKIEQLCRHLERAADWLTLRPDAPLRGLVLGPPGDEAGPILGRGEVVAESPLDVTIACLFERRVVQQPEVTALISAAGALTYRELNDRANQMAHYLADRFRIAPDCRVGVCLERSENLVVAILAVLKAGGAYVPIDPGFPESRIRYLLEDSGAVAVIVDEADGRLGALGDLVSVVEARHASSPMCTDPRPQANGSNLAYVAYTSGSTGRPKGVMIEHRNVINYLNNCVSTFGVTPQDTVYGLTAVTFDISVMELVCSLLIGARLVLEREFLDMDVVASRIRAEGVTVLQMTPSRLHTFLERNSILTLSDVRILLVGGEALSPTLLAELRRLKTTRVFHVYGPTETTIWSSADLIRGDAISLGQPLEGEEIFVISKDSALLPRGFPGEICIAGDGVGRGYLNQPELTAKHFVSFPFLPGRRAYRTGDVGQITMGDHLKFLGRSDAQVKIQGVRVETAEIENQLLLHPDVKEAVILARNKEAGGKGLWAYVVCGAKESELRRHLVERLPYYMVPEVFVFLKALPLTANGKTDRHALLTGVAEVRDSDVTPGPASGVQGKLIEIWRGLLRAPRRIGVNDNFFVLGGNSLKAVQMMGQIETDFRVVLSLQDVFAGPTIAELARLVEAAEWAVAPRGESRPGEFDEFLV